MLRVYLDTNHWVSLLKARVGHKDGARHADALVLLEGAVDRGFASCPLSVEHYMEVQHRSNYSSRIELADTMIELSRWHALAPHSTLLASEVDHALHAIYGKPAFPRRAQAFGQGGAHVWGRPLTEWEPPAAAKDLLGPAELAALQSQCRDVIEHVALVGAPPGFEAPGYDGTVSRRFSASFAEDQEQRRAVRREHDLVCGEGGRRATSVDTFDEFQDTIGDALKLAGLDWGHIYGLKREGMEAFIEAVPILYAHRELRALRHEASVRPWDQGDLNDLSALARAIVYCDVVVTERLWTDLADRAKLGQRFHTTVLRDLDSLTPHLLAAAA